MCVVLSAKDIDVVDNPNVVDDPDVVDGLDVDLDVRAVDLPEGCHQVNFVFVRFWEHQVQISIN